MIHKRTDSQPRGGVWIAPRPRNMPMPSGRLEHINITVSNIERSADLLARLMGWHIRWRGPSQLGGETIHVGSDTDYIAVYTKGAAVDRFAKGLPLNHVGLVVDDLTAAEAVVVAAGLDPFNHADYEPGKRFYFFDWDGIEFEMVSYA
jgi:catechol 2,3-dioxygenase-like lactoylglutathione lyase family enzyme